MLTTQRPGENEVSDLMQTQQNKTRNKNIRDLSSNHNPTSTTATMLFKIDPIKMSKGLSEITTVSNKAPVKINMIKSLKREKDLHGKTSQVLPKYDTLDLTRDPDRYLTEQRMSEGKDLVNEVFEMAKHQSMDLQHM